MCLWAVKLYYVVHLFCFCLFLHELMLTCLRIIRVHGYFTIADILLMSSSYSHLRYNELSVLILIFLRVQIHSSLV